MIKNSYLTPCLSRWPIVFAGIANFAFFLNAQSPVQLEPHQGLPPFEYTDAPAPLPNYVPGAKWGTEADAIRKMQKPLEAAESMKHLVAFPEFETRLFASEPDIAKPICMAWDERGRLWVAETVDYPNNMQKPGEGHDRIKICEDTDGDGRADKFTIFADQLSVPTSLVFANGGIIVVHSGKAEFFKDTDGDDKADVRKVLFTGWGTADTHAGPSNLRYGFDNWIWGVVGYSGFRGTFDGKEIRFGQGIYRFKPDGSKMEFIRASNNNTWGLGFSEEGIVFGSTANGNASMYMPIPNRYYEAVNGWSASRLETIADSQRFYPITEKVRQVDYHGSYTAGAGGALYTARSFPKEYWNQVQFVSEPTGHLIGKFRLEARGADFIAHNERNFAASDDEWTSPIAAEVGPDGALWIIDWYNYVIQHNPTPRGFKSGKGNAYETPLRDKTHGRVYRIVYKGAKTAPSFNLDKAEPEKLVASLKSDNMLWRMEAQRLLVGRANKDVVDGLCKLTRDPSVDEIGLNPGAIHALWTLNGLGLLDGSDRAAFQAAADALKHKSAGVRRAAVTVLPRNEAGQNAVLTAGLLNDASAQVRLAALLAFSEMPASEPAGQAIFAMLTQPENSRDHWIGDAATAAAARNDSAFLKALLARDAEPAGELGRVVGLISRHYASRGPVESIVQTTLALAKAPSLAVPVLNGLVAGWPSGVVPILGETEKQALAHLMESLPESARDRLLALAQRWDRADIFGANVTAIIDSLEKQVTDPSKSDDTRIMAAKRLVGLDDKPETVKNVLKEIDVLTPPGLGAGLVNALTESRIPQTGQALIAHWAQLTPAMRRAAIAVLLRRADWTQALLDAVQKDKIGKTDLAAEHWSQLKQNPDRNIARLAEQLSARSGYISADREEIVKKLLPLAKEKGDPVRGKEVFAATCAVCHTVAGQGGKVGPDLTGIGARDRSEILVDILDPNRSVEANYRLWNVTTKDGETFSGRLETETQTSVEILDTAGQKHVIQRNNMAKLEGSQLSIMPTGFELLPAEDLKSLLEYLTQPPK